MDRVVSSQNNIYKEGAAAWEERSNPSWLAQIGSPIMLCGEVCQFQKNIFLWSLIEWMDSWAQLPFRLLPGPMRYYEAMPAKNTHQYASIRKTLTKYVMVSERVRSLSGFCWRFRRHFSQTPRSKWTIEWVYSAPAAPRRISQKISIRGKYTANTQNTSKTR